MLKHLNIKKKISVLLQQLTYKITRWARTPSKMQGVNDFLSSYSVILKLGTKKELVILENPMFLF